MDLFVIEKLIESRKKSIAFCEGAVKESEFDASQVPPGPVRKLFERKVKANKLRLELLRSELSGLQAEAARLQPELPGVAPKKAPGAK